MNKKINLKFLNNISMKVLKILFRVFGRDKIISEKVESDLNQIDSVHQSKENIIKYYHEKIKTVILVLFVGVIVLALVILKSATQSNVDLNIKRNNYGGGDKIINYNADLPT